MAFSATLFLQLIVNGLLTGLFFALIALGLSIIWGVTRIINIAHGEFVVLGAYITYFMFYGYHLNVYVSSFIAGIIVAIIAMGIQYSLYNRVRQEHELITLIITFGVSILLMTLMTIFFTPDFRFLNPRSRYQTVNIGGVSTTLADLFAALVSVILIGVVSAFLYYTDVGRAIRAVAQDREAALLMGVDEEKIYVVTMGISGFTAGVAGGILATLYAFTPYVGSIYLGWSFAITILGGLGSIPGVLLAGLIVGIARALTILVKSDLAPAVAFIIMIIAMIIRPRGLFGRVAE